MPARTLSSADIVPNRRMFWKVRPMPSAVTSCGLRDFSLEPFWNTIALPSNSISPAVGTYAPVIMLKNVVLPAPLGPMSDTIARRGMSKSTLLTASRPPNRLVTPRALTSRSSSGMAPVSPTGAARSVTGSPLPWASRLHA